MASLDDVLGRINDVVVGRPTTVVVAFLLVTGLFAPGLTTISTEAGTEQFTQDSPAQTAFDRVNEDFGPTFETGGGSTQLIHRGRNVLSKPELLRMLGILERLESREDLRVASTNSAAGTVARTLDPSATTPDEQIRAVEDAAPAEIDRAVGEAAEGPGFRSLLSEDFNAESARASATITVVQHRIPGGVDEAAGMGGDSPLTPIQQRIQRMVQPAGGNVVVFGSGLVAAEFSTIIFDSLFIVVPAAVALIFVFLLYAYRNPVDLFLGVLSLLMTVVWTLGFLGLTGIPFTQLLIAIPPLLLAVGIDFGLHAINRYREERAEGFDVRESMAVSNRQLLVAFFIVTGTTVIGFSANTVSDLGPIRDFGIIAAVGIVFTFLIFGVFLPAAKVAVDELFESLGIPMPFQRPLGREETPLGRVLPVGVAVARRAPAAFLVVVLLGSAWAGYYGTGVDTAFSQDDFLPPEDNPDYLEELPEPFRPGEYTVTERTNFLEENFASAQDDTVVVYLRRPLRQDDALESIQRAGLDPPESFVAENRRAEAESILDVIRSHANQSASFARLLRRSDVDGDGVPDDNVEAIFDALLSSSAREQALRYVTEDLRSTRVVYTTESDAEQSAVTRDARVVADRYRYDATATGAVVVFQDVADAILLSSVRSLLVALTATAVFLVVIYYALVGRPSLGVVNLVPILVTIALLAGTMRYFGLPFNALTATILSISLGLGIDYSAHFVHRFVDEYDARVDDESELASEGRGTETRTDAVVSALRATVTGTGGALTGSMLTTVSGTGVLVLAITPVLGQFGVLTALSILYSYLTAMVVTPSVVVLWARYVG
ncbi:efflux RND transporter permease subunit [Haloarcula nitratireducens]|uniref:MMPL family transporter n=1 Tax=Haloarcula nitratireducens TaxID=2487749 RepID=A0AAW4P8T2_9EURY|nr:MMPL family transporter [Halomicroarcula nitratireducens]MBX0294286.1 MMPL family transporter [Halomicroarcula nitratireducens]